MSDELLNKIADNLIEGDPDGVVELTRDAIAAGKLCKKLGLKINVAAKIAESSIGTTAAIHLACAVPNVDWGVSLTNMYLAEDIVKQPIALRDGHVALPEGPGLGVEIDETAVARLRVR